MTEIRTRFGRRRILVEDASELGREIELLTEPYEEWRGVGAGDRRTLWDRHWKAGEPSQKRKRLILNLPVQGGAADAAKLAMVRIRRDLPAGVTLGPKPMPVWPNEWWFASTVPRGRRGAETRQPSTRQAVPCRRA